MANKVVNASLFTLIMMSLMAGVAYAVPPIVQDDLFFSDEDDGLISEDVFANDSPTSGPNLSVIGYAGPPGLDISLGGILTYTPPAHFSGLVPFTYDVRENDVLLCFGPPNPDCFRSASGQIFVQPRADLPAVSGGPVSGDEETPIPLGLTIVPVDTSEQITVTIDNLPTGAVLSAGSQQPDESWILTEAEAAGVSLTAPTDFTGLINVDVDVVTLDEVLDHNAVLVQDSDSTNLLIPVTVNNVDDDPVYVGPTPSIVTPEEVDASVSLAGVVTDVDAGDTLSYVVTTVANSAINTASMSGSTLNITLLANANEIGGSVTVQVSDADGGAAVDVVVPVDVTPLNDNPTATGTVLTFTTDEDVNDTLDIAAMVDDPDVLTNSDTLTYTVINVNNLAVDTASMSGSVLSVTLLPDQNAVGGSVDIEVTDDAATNPLMISVPVNVNPVNDDPFINGAVPTIELDEDFPNFLDLFGVIDDVDIATNSDSLNGVVLSVDNTAIDQANVFGTMVVIIPFPNAFEVGGSVTIRFFDDAGAYVDAVVPVDINPINDPPFRVLVLPPVEVDEDAPNEVVDYSGVFLDIDPGDTLTLSAAFDSGDPGLFSSITMAGEDLILDFAENANGLANLLITATDSAGATRDEPLQVRVWSVNDAPFVVGGLSDRNIDEDDPPEVVSLLGVFDDVDIATNGDSLVYEVDSVENPGLFTTAISGDDLTITLVPDANGESDISVIARDGAGAASPPVTFNVTINGVDDLPVAAPDVLADVDEDSGEMRIDVTANDYLGDVPTTLVSLTNMGTHDMIDVNGDITPTDDVTAEIDGNEVVFTPTPDFWGQADFEYIIRDSNGDESTALVTFYVNPINDPPEGRQDHRYSVFEGATLDVEAVNGLLVGAYDVDPSQVDVDGNPIAPQPLSVVFETSPPAAEGTLLTTASDGSFSFLPAPDFIGETTFEYTVFDNTLKSTVGTVVIEVLELPPVGEAPAPGEVAVFFSLANTPLEQSSSVSPNVLVTMDDSGSMDWHITVDSSDDNGRFVIDNDSIATSNRRERLYTYLFALNVNTYGATSGNGRVLPSQESLPAGNDYEVWQARSSAFNNIYYNPQVRYNPWSGLDNANVDFANAVKDAVRLDPISASNTIDITQRVSYLSSSVPNWASGGGTSNITVTNYLIPRYYTATGTLVEIEDDGSDNYPGGDERDDCVINDNDHATCTYDEEIQNFANWFQYYRSREHVAKAAIGNVVAELQDIRVGYETINRRFDEPIAEMNEYYWEGEKKELLDTIYEVYSASGTPLRRALDDAGQLLGCNRGDRDCPALPAPEGVCQQNFSLLFSDGYWNGSTPLSGNFDQDGLGPFDGGKYADTHSDTLADIAMFYYENDLFPGTSDGVPLALADIDGVPEGTFASTNEQIHQHMKTFTIAFGVEPDINVETAEQANATASFTWPAPGSAANAKIDDMLHAAINGRGRFLNAGDPGALQTAVGTAFREFLQAASSSSAAAFNSTSLREGTLLYRGFYDLRNRTGELTATTVGTDGVIQATPDWTAARLLDEDDISGKGLAPSERVIFTYNPIDKLGIPFDHTELTDNQKVTFNANQVDYMRGVDTFEEPTGSLRARLDKEGRLGDIVNSSPIFVGAPRAFNRDQSPYPTSALYSEFVANVQDRQKMVYVGANDGMLHGFNADKLGGEEIMAYMPNMIIDSSQRYSNKLNAFTSPFYLHDYYVDLTPRLNDVFMRPNKTGSKQWMTTLVGGLGAGGKGYFALNVTDPDNMFADEGSAKAAALWEFTDQDDTYPEDVSGNPIGGAVGAITDFNDQPVKDLGYALSLPTITMSNAADTDSEKEWVALFGNGTNSTSGIATLFLLFMDKGLNGWQDGDFVKISTGYGVPLPGEQLEGYPNALGTPTAVDEDLNGTVDYVYAGDRLGNLFRFDVRSANPDNWDATRLFTASYDDGSGGDPVLQPILSKPLVVKHPDQNGFLVTFGTGSFIADEDGKDTSIQSIYTIWDSLVDNPPTAADDTKVERLVEQVITNVVDDTVSPAQTRRILTTNTVGYTPETGDPGVYGWYIDLNMQRAEETVSSVPNTDMSGLAPPDPQFPGEKAIRRFIYRDGVILTTTVLPATDATSCFGSRPGAILILDGLTGGDPGEAVVDFNLDGYVDSADLLAVDGQTYTAGLVFDFTELDGQLVDLSTLGGEGDTDFLFICGGNECISRRIRDVNDNKTGRLSWTELQTD